MNIKKFKNFFSSILNFIFDIFFPYSMEKKLEILEEIFKEKSISKKNIEEEKINKNVSLIENFLMEIARNFPKNSFKPYAFYNSSMNTIEVYLKDESCMTQSLNDQLDLYISFDTNEIIGVKILNIRKLLEQN